MTDPMRRIRLRRGRESTPLSQALTIALLLVFAGLLAGLIYFVMRGVQ